MSAFRPDRLLTLGLMQPCRRILGGDTTRVPVLMYHSISEEASETGYFGLATSPRRFAAHLQRLRDQGWQTLQPDEISRHVGASGRYVVITFDDGYRDNLVYAAPLLRQFGFTAIIYLPTDFISRERRQFKGRECLTWAEVRELQRAGLRFGSHTVTHRELRCLSEAEVREELVRSRETMEQEIGAPVTAFAYPYAFPEADRSLVKRLRGQVQQAGYATAVTTIIGRVAHTDDPLLMKRLPINEADDSAFFAAKLAGAYDWLHGPQFLRKFIRRG